MRHFLYNFNFIVMVLHAVEFKYKLLSNKLKSSFSNSYLNQVKQCTCLGIFGC